MYRVIVIVLAFMLGVFIFFGADSAKTSGQKINFILKGE